MNPPAISTPTPAPKSSTSSTTSTSASTPPSSSSLTTTASPKAVPAPSLSATPALPETSAGEMWDDPPPPHQLALHPQAPPALRAHHSRHSSRSPADRQHANHQPVRASR